MSIQGSGPLEPIRPGTPAPRRWLLWAAVGALVGLGVERFFTSHTTDGSAAGWTVRVQVPGLILYEESGTEAEMRWAAARWNYGTAAAGALAGAILGLAAAAPQWRRAEPHS